MVYFTLEKEKAVSKRQTSSNRRAQSRASLHQVFNCGGKEWQIAEKEHNIPGMVCLGFF